MYFIAHSKPLAYFKLLCYSDYFISFCFGGVIYLLHQFFSELMKLHQVTETSLDLAKFWLSNWSKISQHKSGNLLKKSFMLKLIFTPNWFEIWMYVYFQWQIPNYEWPTVVLILFSSIWPGQCWKHQKSAMIWQ